MGVILEILDSPEVITIPVSGSSQTVIEQWAGLRGEKGDKGDPNIITIGNVTKVGAGENPTAGIRGESPNQILDLGIPASARILQGTVVPAAATGSVGDWYLNTSSWDVYEKTAAATWTYRGNIRGATGPANVITLGATTVLNPSQDPTVSLTGTSPSQTLSFGIPRSAEILSGTTAPAGATGTVGDWYINTADWNMYEKTAASTWTLRMNIRGATGPANTLAIGTVTTAIPGSSAAASITGTAPNQTLSLTIPKGATILQGSVAPATGTGTQGDWYINISNWDIYEKTATSTWTLRGNIKGAKGDTGNTGATGPANTLSVGTVTASAPGSTPAVTITGAAPTQTISFTLPRGDTGPTGPAPNLAIGTVTGLAAGATPTATVTGTNPNYVINMGIPKGDKGDVGAQWITGASAPAAGTGVVGDFYLVTGITGTGDVYKKTGASTWTLQGNIRGQAGTGNVNSINSVLPDGAGNVVLTWSNFSGTIPASALPSLATVETYSVASQAAMLALSAQRGDLAIRTDLDETYILSGDDPAVLGNWTQLLTDGGNVRLTGDQTIGGIKTFSSAPVVPDSSFAISKTSGLQAALDSKQATIAAGTTAQYYRGDKTWQTLNASAVGLGNVTNAAQVTLTGDQTVAGIKTFSSAPVVPDASFTIAKVNGLQGALDGKAATTHNHDAGAVTTGTFAIARIPTGTTSTTVALGNHLHTGVYEPLLANGTTAQYYRGDKQWATLNAAAVGLGNVTNDAQVTLTGNQSISGLKTFTPGIIIGDLQDEPAAPATGSILYTLWGAPYLKSSSGYITDLTPLNRDMLSEKAATVATTTNITLSGLQTVDGVVLSNENIVLVKNQTTASQNGLYSVSSGAWTRHTSADANFKLGGAFATVEKGTQAGTMWVTDFPSNGVLGVADVNWYRVSDSRNTVTTTGNQSIAGVKTFTSAPLLSSLADSRVVTTGAGGALGVSTVTTTELGYLSGVTSAVQTQLNGKQATITAGTTAQYYRGDKTWQTLNVAAVSGAAPLASPTFTGTVSGITAAMVGLGNVSNALQVTIAGTETITGAKTFSAGISVQNSFNFLNATSTLGGVAGDIAINHEFRHSAQTNNFRHVTMMHRRAAGTDWTTAQSYQGIAIDTSYAASPTTGGANALKTWIRRDPQGGTIGFGDGTTESLAVSGTNVSIKTGSLLMENSTSNILNFNTAGVAAPTFTTRSVGTKVILYQNVGASSVDYALGIESGHLWTSVSGNNNSVGFKWYGGTTNIMTLRGDGILSVAGAVQTTATTNSVNTQDFVFTTGNEARPTGTKYVRWIGPVTPVNAANDDTWVQVA